MFNQKEYQRKWRAANREKVNAQQRAWYAAHPDYHREYREKNRQKLREYRREYMKAWRAANKEKVSKTNHERYLRRKAKAQAAKDATS